jgi:putative addiction module component (TIGR02574 family)
VTNAAQQVFERALGLSEEEREQLIEELARSLNPVELSPAWQAEIGRRIEAIERGEAVIHPDARVIVRRLRDKYG